MDSARLLVFFSARCSRKEMMLILNLMSPKFLYRLI